MTKFDIPFSGEMADAVDEGRKLCTSRNKKYGEPGDYFILRDYTYRLVDVQTRTLAFVATNFYRLEGFDEPAGFIDIWERLHAGKGFVSDQKVFVHFFARIQRD